MNLLDSFDPTQMFADTPLFDPNAGVSGNTFDLPFVTVGTGSGGTVAAQPSSFWSSFGGSLGNLFTGVSQGAVNSIPAVLANLTSKSDPNPKAGAAEQQTTAQKVAQQTNSSLLKYGLMALLFVGTLGLAYVLLRPRRKGK